MTATPPHDSGVQSARPVELFFDLVFVFTVTQLSGVLGLLLVTVIHMVMFARVPNASAQAIQGIAPYNLAAAGLVLAAAFVAGPAHWALWGAAVMVLLLATLRRQEQTFELSPRQSSNVMAC